MKSEPGTIHRTTQLRTVFIDIILLLLSKGDKRMVLYGPQRFNHKIVKIIIC